MAEEPFPDRLRRLAAARGLSVERIGAMAWDPKVRGTSVNHLKKVIYGQRALTPTLIEAIAGALDVPPEEFPEYRLAMARRALDETEVGLDEALAALNRIEPVLRGRRRGRRAAARSTESPERPPADRSAPRNRKPA
jgi:transcriptional regulator with XRE-family HTH domain